jgi:hypothetical protein
MVSFLPNQRRLETWGGEVIRSSSFRGRKKAARKVLGESLCDEPQSWPLDRQAGGHA